MKKAIFLTAVACLSALSASLNSSHSEGAKESDKQDRIYIDRSRLEFSESGIHLRTDSHGMVPLSQINCDSRGYYLSSSLLNALFVCRHCGYTYRVMPAWCEMCGWSSFGLIDTYPD